MEVTYFSALLGMIAFNSVNVVRHIVTGNLTEYFSPLLDVNNVLCFVFLAVVSTIIAKYMGNFALSHIQTSTVAAFGGLYTIVTITAGVVFAGEKLYYYHLIGIAHTSMRMIGVSYISIKKDRLISK